MASISGVSGSNTMSSLMNSANMVSGLASGMDTEGMIESLVQSYQTKIQSLSQKVAKTEWKQDAYRSIISKMVGFSNKYTSYTSGTNLMSASFFNSAARVATQGLYKDLVSASGKSSSDITLNSVSQLATAAQYRTNSNMKAGDGKSIEASSGIDLNGKTTLGTLSGSLSLTYGSQTVSIQFDEVADVEAMKDIRAKLEKDGKPASDTDVLAELINQKLGDQQITLSTGAEDADERIGVEVKDGSITFSDKSKAGNSVYVSGASDGVKNYLGLNLDNASEEKPKSIAIPSNYANTKQVDNAAYLSGKSMNLSLDGTTKTITLPKITGSKEAGYKIVDSDGKTLDYNADNYAKVLNEAVNKAFKGKVEVKNTGSDGELKLRFDVQEGSNLVINTDVGETLGIGRTATSYMNVSKTLGDLLGEDTLSGLTQATKVNSDGTVEKLTDDKGDPLYAFEINGVNVGNFSKNSTLSEVMSAINGNKEAGVRVSYSQTTKNFLFTSKETGADSEVKMGEGLAQAMFSSTEIPDNSGNSFADAYGVSWVKDGKSADLKFSISGNSSLDISITDETSLQDVVDTLNNSPMGMNSSFSLNKYTGQIEARDKKSGALQELKIEDSFGDKVEFDQSKAPAVDYTPGQDAKFNVTVNGENIEMTRSSNTVTIDGLSITMKDVFNGYEDADGNPAVDSAGNPKNAVTFSSSVDADKIVDAVKSMLEDYNAMMAEIKSAYSTMPYQKTDGTFANYEPLTEDERRNMSESEIQRYEEKAKQGILFGDRNLSNLYDKMRNIFNLSGEDGATLRAMGISTSYSTSDGVQTVTLDESKLRDMLESDPDRVTDLFTRTDGAGGIMQNMKTQLDRYAKTSGEPKGILVQQSGTPLSSLSLLNNNWQKEIDNINTQIDKWKDKLTTQVDRYTQQFTRLEMLINQMNSQSSTLAGLMGG